MTAGVTFSDFGIYLGTSGKELFFRDRFTSKTLTTTIKINSANLGFKVLYKGTVSNRSNIEVAVCS